MIFCSKCLIFYDRSEGCPVCGPTPATGGPKMPMKSVKKAKSVKKTKPVKKVKSLSRMTKAELIDRLTAYENALKHVKNLVTRVLEEGRY